MLFGQVSLLPVQASTFALKVDLLYFFLIAVSAIMSILIFGLILYFALRYRRRSDDERPAQIHGSTALEVGSIALMGGVSLIIFVWGAWLFVDLFRPPDNTLDVYVVAKQWMWKLQHPGGQREINELHVPVGKAVRLKMTSEDVIHSFFVPAFRVKHDVLPGRYTTAWFEATKVGRYHLFCAEYCGTWHSRMAGTVVVMEPSEYQQWLGRQADGSLATQGRQLFLKLQCIACHNAGGDARAPSLENLYGRSVPLVDGRVALVDDDYIRKSIQHPKADVVAGFQPIMPTYQGQVSEEDILRLIAFIRSLGTGDTPNRVELTPAPSGPAETTPAGKSDPPGSAPKVADPKTAVPKGAP